MTVQIAPPLPLLFNPEEIYQMQMYAMAANLYAMATNICDGCYLYAMAMIICNGFVCMQCQSASAMATYC